MDAVCLTAFLPADPHHRRRPPHPGGDTHPRSSNDCAKVRPSGQLARSCHPEPGRGEADIQAGVRDVLLYGGFDLGDEAVVLESPPHVLREIACHADIGVTTTLYAHASLDERAKGLQLLSDALS